MPSILEMVGRSCSLLLVVAVPALAQSVQAPASAMERPSDRDRAAVSPGKQIKRWDQKLKKIPLGTPIALQLSFTGQARWRSESFRSFNLSSIDDDNSQSRLVFGTELAAGKSDALHARAFSEVRDAQSYGRSLPGRARPSDADRFDFQSLFAELGFQKSFVRYGRQEISFNRDRLIGVPDWSNTRRSSQGLRAQLAYGSIVLEAASFRPVIVRQTASNLVDSTTRYRTLSIGRSVDTKSARPSSNYLPAFWQVYVYEQDINSPSSSSTTTRTTSGGRLQWQWGVASSSRFGQSLEIEAASQRGHAGNKSLRSWFWIAEGQWQWKKLSGKPSVAFGIEQASGERPNTGDRIEAFFVPAAAGHSHGGYADIIGRQNKRELHLISTWDATSALALRGALYRFQRLSTDDGAYTKQNSLFRAASGSREKHIADELDVTATLKINPNLRILAGGALVNPGAFLKTTPGGAQRNLWGYIGSTFTF